MEIPELICLLFLFSCYQQAHSQALFFRNDLGHPSVNTNGETNNEVAVRDSSASHSEPARTYLPVPPSSSERPRPFQPNPTPTAPPKPNGPETPSFSPGGYPQVPSPRPPFFEQTRPPFFEQTRPPVVGTSSSGNGVYLPPVNTELPPYQPPQTLSPLEDSVVPTGPGTAGESSGSQGGEILIGGGDSVPSGGTGIGPGQQGGGENNDIVGTPGAQGEDESHPPHIHAIDVQCSKEEMTINIEFSRVFNGVIYSKGYYREPSCRYVLQNSGQIKYSFTVRLDSCGTQFINNFKEGGQAYLENVLVLQNEPGIQEVWDSAQRVRCLWEGSLKQSLTVELNVDMLNQETVTFSGDTGSARLEIQVGKGPFAPAANGLVKIGETMTLVVYVEGDSGFDVQVRQCIARDAKGDNVVQLTDEQGCVLRPKLMGSFQKTKQTGSSSASIIAYAFFQAFKFPDVMDLTFECNVELCKTDCDGCPAPGQNINPVSRRRRDLWSDNSTAGEPMKVFRSFRVISPEDIDDLEALTGAGSTVINIGSQADGICMSMSGFLLASIFLLTVLLASCLMAAYLWVKQQRSKNSHNINKMLQMDILPAQKS